MNNSALPGREPDSPCPVVRVAVSIEPADALWKLTPAAHARPGRGMRTLGSLAILVLFSAGAFLAGAQWGPAVVARFAPAQPQVVAQPVEAAPVLAAPEAPSTPADPDLWAPPILLDALPKPGEGLGGEYDRQSAILLGANEMVRHHPKFFVDLVAETHRHVPLIALISSEEERITGENLLQSNGLPLTAVHFVTVPVGTMWVRDYGPHFTRRADGTTELVDTEWAPALDEPDEGMEYSPPRLIAERLGMRAQAGRVRIPGGNLINNGDGLVVTTAAVLGENLPLGLDRTQLQMRMRRLFGARNWLCLEPLDGEPTGHVDMFVTFPAADVALVGQMDPAKDATNARILDDAATAIASQKTSDGKPIRVYRIPMPDGSDGIWRSYTNGIYANGVAVVPIYTNVPPEMNQKALALYQKVLPHWKVVGINADSVIELGGAVHCVTMNVPSFVKIDLAVIRALEKAAPRRVAVDGEEMPTCDGDHYEPDDTDADVPEPVEEEFGVPERSAIDTTPLRAA